MWKCHLSHCMPGVKHNRQLCSVHSPHSCSFKSSTEVAWGNFHPPVKVQDYPFPLWSPLSSLSRHCSFQFLTHTALQLQELHKVQFSHQLVFVSPSFLSCRISLETPPEAFLALWIIMAIQHWGKPGTGEHFQHLKNISDFHKGRAEIDHSFPSPPPPRRPLGSYFYNLLTKPVWFDSLLYSRLHRPYSCARFVMRSQAVASGSSTFTKFLPHLHCKKSSAGPTCL